MSIGQVMRTRKVWFFLAFGLVLVLGLVARKINRSPSELPFLGSLPGFELVNQNGEEFSRAGLLGKVWVTDFIFTTCSGPCPVMSKQFAELQDEFSEVKDFNLLSISVNPEYDTPPVLKEYGHRYSADPGRWVFATGDRSDIHKLAVEGFHVGSVENPVFHSTRFILVDRDAQIRGYYVSSTLEEMKKLRQDIAQLIG